MVEKQGPAETPQPPPPPPGNTSNFVSTKLFWTEKQKTDDSIGPALTRAIRKPGPPPNEPPPQPQLQQQVLTLQAQQKQAINGWG